MKVFPGAQFFFGSQGKRSVVVPKSCPVPGDRQRDCKVSMREIYRARGCSLANGLDRIAMVACDEVHPTPVNQGLGL